MPSVELQSEYRDLPLESPVESPLNPRRSFDQDALEELAETVRTQGILSPLLVRPLGEHTYEIVAGAKRYADAQRCEGHFKSNARLGNMLPDSRDPVWGLEVERLPQAAAHLSLTSPAAPGASFGEPARHQSDTRNRRPCRPNSAFPKVTEWHDFSSVLAKENEGA